MAEFSPRELDQLEDALENLEGVDDVTSLGLSEPLTRRLEEYQAVLSASREALPMEEVPDGLLDGVLAEAGDAPPRTEQRAGLWARWRKTLIPVFALAGTTAAVLWIVRPDEDATEATATAPPAAAGDARAEQAAEEQPPGAAPGDDAEQPEAAPTEVLDDTVAEGEDAPARLEPPAEKAGAPKDDRGGRAAVQQDAASPEPAVAPEPQQQTKAEYYEDIQRAHDLRHAGSCRDAKRLYARLLSTAPNGSTRGEILMGLGLCEEALGDGAAARHLEDAIAAHPGLEGEIEREREMTRSPLKKKGKPRPKKRSKAKATPDTQNAYTPD